MLAVRPWLIVFDLDGTLIDSSLDLCLAVNASLHHVGAASLPHEQISTFIGDGAAMLLERALQASAPKRNSSDSPASRDGRVKRALTYFLSYYGKHKLDHTITYPGVLGSLETIRMAEPALPMAVLTNKPVRASREICQGLGLAPYFFAVYGGNSFTTKKPAPDGLLTLIAEARALSTGKRTPSPEDLTQVVMVGDSATDVLTARAAGTLALGCRYGLAPDTLTIAVPDMLCDSPAVWPQLLGFA